MHQDKKQKVSRFVASTRRQLCRVDTSEWSSFPVLTAVRLVCRECLYATEDEGLLRVTDSYLDELSGSLSLPAAYEKSEGSLRLLQYLAARESKMMDPFLRRWEGNYVTGQMGARGDLKSLKWITEEYIPGEFLTEVIAQACSNGHLDIVKWLWENHHDMGYWGGIELVEAIRHNDHELVEWLRNHIDLRPDCAQYVIKQAAACGNLGIVEWLYTKFDVEVGDALHAAASNGLWHVTRWFIDNVKRADLDAALGNEVIYLSPARHGDLDMLKYLDARDLVPEAVEVLQMAAAHGHLDMVKWLHEEKRVTNAGRGFYLAAENGHLAMLKYLYEKKLDTGTTQSALDAAAGSGFFEIAQWLHFNTQAQCTHQAMDQAAGRGHLGIVQWLHTNRAEGCSYLAMHFAAENGHLETVKWLHANRSEGCHVLTMKRTAEHGNLEMVKWLHANRHEAFDLDGVMDAAAVNGNVEMLQWFQENRDGGCTTAAMDQAASNGHLEVVKWLHEHRSEGCTHRAMDDAAKNGHLDVVRWLHVNRSEGCTTLAIDGAAGNSHLNIVKWLRDNRLLRCTPLALAWLFSKPTRLDTAVFLYSEFPECRSFHLGHEFEVEWLEVVQWILDRAPGALEGCTLRVKSWNWYAWEWLKQNNWKQLDMNTAFSYWKRPA